MYVRGHATALLSSHRNEGDHRNLRLDSRSTYNISAPLLMARLRHEQTQEYMQMASFIAFASKHWHRRGKGSVTHQLLSHMFPAYRLNEMSWHMKSLHVYASAISDLFADVSPAAGLVRNFKLSLFPAARTVLTPVEKEAVQMCTSAFQLGKIVSLPHGLVTARQSSVPLAVLSYAAIIEAMQSVRLLPLQELVDGCMFLEIGLSRQRMSLATCDSIYSVRCSLMEVLEHDGEHVHIIRSGTDVDVDFAAIISSEKRLQVFTEIRCWECVDSQATVAAKRFRLCDALATNAARMSAPALTDDDLSLASLIGARDYAFDRASSSSTMARQDQALDTLMERGATVGAPVEQLPTHADVGEHIETINALVARDLVALSVDDFGESRLALVDEGTFLRSRLSVRFADFLPPRVVEIQHLSHSLTKLELVAVCLGNGWCIGDLLPSFAAHGPRIFSLASLSSNKWFWVVLSCIDSMFSKGVTRIFTGLPAKYYEYVFRLRDAKQLEEYGSAVKTWSHQQWCAMLSGRDPLACPSGVIAALEDADEQPEDDDGAASVIVDLPLPPELRVAASASSVRPPIEFVGLTVLDKPVRVFFDGESHQSGPRCYVVCPKHVEEQCRKYMFIHHFPSVRECAVSLAAWQLGCVRSNDRRSHVPSPSTEAELDSARQHCPLIQ